MNLKKV